MAWQGAVLVAYLVVLALLCVVSLHRLRLVAAGRRPDPRPEALHDHPFVTVQLPVYDERYVVERLIAAAGELEWPRDRLQIQVLDDSTDDTTALAALAVQRLRDRGVDAVLIHRSVRRGFKAGALADGMVASTGEFVAIFDADFVPNPDFLRRTVPILVADPAIGMVQARWGHLGADANWLTTAQATLLDGHFGVEHAARYALGRWFNFNGTAGVWRRDAMIDAGGWSADTLTEDLDLSYRAQMRGWSFVYLHDLVVPAELPADLVAFRSQQRRWARGSVQTARKLMGPILASDAAPAVKLEAAFHLGANLAYPLALALCALLPVSIVARDGMSELRWLDFALFACSTGSAFAVYAVAIARSGDRRWQRFAAIPVAMALGLGMSLAQTRAVVEGLASDGGVFVRTPKRGAGRGGYRLPVDGLAVAELALAAYIAAGGLYAAMQGYFASLPFIALVGGGFFAVGARAISEARARTTGTQVANHSQGASVQVPDAASNVARTA
jgi:cellulose synthase/poly-beta-1,6-N-acetylglucosamine synthase-like glycosyltransferase